MATDDEVVLPPDPVSARQARRFVSETLGQIDAEAAEKAVLLVSELVTNALLHARTHITVSVKRLSDRVRIDVADESPEEPRQRTHSDEATTGRGLELISMLASDWGHDLTPDGKSVWFEIAITSTAPAEGQ